MQGQAVCLVRRHPGLKMDAGVGLKPTRTCFKGKGPIVSRSGNGDCTQNCTEDIRVAAERLAAWLCSLKT